MALIFADGFDAYDDLADVLTTGFWAQNAATSGVAYSTSAGRYGGGAIVIGPGSAGFGYNFIGAQSATQNFYCFWFNRWYNTNYYRNFGSLY
jgi:hypothetical protein